MEKITVFKLTMESLDGPLILTTAPDLFESIKAEIINYTADGERHGYDEDVEIKIEILRMTQQELDELPDYQ